MDICNMKYQILQKKDMNEDIMLIAGNNMNIMGLEQDHHHTIIM